MDAKKACDVPLKKAACIVDNIAASGIQGSLFNPELGLPFVWSIVMSLWGYFNVANIFQLVDCLLLT